MTAIMNPESHPGSSVANFSNEPGQITEFLNRPPPESVQELVNIYNGIAKFGSKQAIFDDLPEVTHSRHGLDFCVHGEEPSETVVVMANPFATDLSEINCFRGKFMFESMRAQGVVGNDGVTPQVLQTASASRMSNVSLCPLEQIKLARGSLSPITDKIARVVVDELPESERVISAGYSLAAFLTPDILLSLSKDREVIAGLVSNSPGVIEDTMPGILKKFANSGRHMDEHIRNSGLSILTPENIGSLAMKLSSKLKTIEDVIWRPINLSLWLSFTRGKLLDRVEALERKVPSVQIEFAFGDDDPICSPIELQKYVIETNHTAVKVENGDHCWGVNLPRSLGDLATSQIQGVLMAA